MKKCTKCGQNCSASKFKPEKRAIDGLSSACRKCINIGKRQHYHDNKEKCDTRSKAYYLKHRDKILAYKSRWRKENKDKVAISINRRRDRKRLAKPAWYEVKQVANIYRTCRAMNGGDRKYHVDHIIPLIHSSVCGLHCLDNLRIVSSSVNLEKGRKF